MNQNLAGKIKNAKRFDSLMRLFYEASIEADADQLDLAEILTGLATDFSVKDIPYEVYRREFCQRLDNLLESLENAGLSEHQL